MKKFLVKGQEIVGEFAGIEIAGYQAVESQGLNPSEDLDITELFVDTDGLVKPKPPAPSESAYWSTEDRAWVEVPPPEPTPVVAAPNYTQFRMQMRRSPDYRAIVEAVNPALVAELAGAISQQPPNLQAVAEIWADVIGELPAPPRVVELNAIAQKCEMPFRFALSGLLEMNA